MSYTDRVEERKEFLKFCYVQGHFWRQHSVFSDLDTGRLAGLISQDLH